MPHNFIYVILADLRGFPRIWNNNLKLTSNQCLIHWFFFRRNLMLEDSMPPSAYTLEFVSFYIIKSIQTYLYLGGPLPVAAYTWFLWKCVYCASIGFLGQWSIMYSPNGKLIGGTDWKLSCSLTHPHTNADYFLTQFALKENILFFLYRQRLRNIKTF